MDGIFTFFQLSQHRSIKHWEGEIPIYSDWSDGMSLSGRLSLSSALAHYFGKWKVAKEHASTLHASYSDAWWMSARTYYLELGGEYKHQLPKEIREREELEGMIVSGPAVERPAPPAKDED